MKKKDETSGQRMIRALKSHYSHGARMMRLLEEYKKQQAAIKGSSWTEM